MHEIEMQDMSPEFHKCWQAAGRHLNNQVEGGIQFWLRAHPSPPFLEHLSFRLGNQLFFVRVEDADGRLEGPGSLNGLHAVAEGNLGHACLMPMRKVPPDGRWVPQRSGWGLLGAATRTPIDPASLVTDERIEMTPWELHDMAVQAVRDHLKEHDYELMNWHSNPKVDPAIWFVGDSKGPEWVVVRAARYPDTRAPRPPDWQAIARSCARGSRIGHFASVAVASAEDSFAAAIIQAEPLWRGYAMRVRFTGLE